MFSQSVLTQRPVTREPQSRIGGALLTAPSGPSRPFYAGNAGQIVVKSECTIGLLTGELFVYFYDTIEDATAGANPIHWIAWPVKGFQNLIRLLPIFGSYITIALSGTAGQSCAVTMWTAPAGIRAIDLLGAQEAATSSFFVSVNNGVGAGGVAFFEPVGWIAPGLWQCRYDASVGTVRLQVQQMTTAGWRNTWDGGPAGVLIGTERFSVVAAPVRLALINTGAGAANLVAVLTPAPD